MFSSMIKIGAEAPCSVSDRIYNRNQTPSAGTVVMDEKP